MTRLFIGTALCALAALGYVGATVAAGGSHVPAGHVAICHHTGASQAHEWVYITPAADGVLDGHGHVGHQFNEDIIPPFTLVRHGETISFPGLNLDERLGVDLEPNPDGPYTGAAILANKCDAPAADSTTATSPDSTTITTPSVSTVTVTTPSGTTTVKVKVPGPQPKKAKLPPTRAKAPFTR